MSYQLNWERDLAVTSNVYAVSYPFEVIVCITYLATRWGIYKICALHIFRLCKGVIYSPVEKPPKFAWTVQLRINKVFC